MQNSVAAIQGRYVEISDGNAMLRALAHRILENPAVFQIQQRIFNNYGNLAAAFAKYLTGPGLSMLDVGCSTAACAGSIIDMTRNSYLGVDIEPRYIELAETQNPLGKFLCSDARRLPLEDDTFDVVMFNGVWHHMDDDLIASCLKEVHRVLKPEGMLLVAEPVYRRDWPISTWLLNNDRGKHIRDRAGYRAFLQAFDVVEEKTFQLSFHEFCGFVARKKAAEGA